MVRAAIFVPFRLTALAASLRVASPADSASPVIASSFGILTSPVVASISPSLSTAISTSGASSATPLCWNCIAQDSAAASAAAGEWKSAVMM